MGKSEIAGAESSVAASTELAATSGIDMTAPAIASGKVVEMASADVASVISDILDLAAGLLL
jgi:hypothetical protein